MTPLRAIALALCALLATSATSAANHALILTLGTYANPDHNLKGGARDAELAHDIALRMGVPAGNTVWLKNEQLTRSGLGQALKSLVARIARDDKVFIYFSGHGVQSNRVGTPGEPASGCSEALATYEGSVYYDADLRQDLDKLAAKASQVVMFNDSCFAGGTATKALASPTGNSAVDATSGNSPGPETAKYYTGPVNGGSGASAKAGSASDPGYVCGRAVNEPASKLFRSFEGAGRSSQVFYLAGAADNELGFSTPQGSLATLAWSACLKDPATDSDGSGLITGEELVTCANRYIKARHKGVQRVTAQFNGQLPMSFARPDAAPPAAPGTAVTPAAPAAPGPSATPGAPSQRINPVAALRNIASGADPAYRVQLATASSQLRIRQDFLQFSVTSNRSGYLYVFQVGSDRKTFNLIFPNHRDQANAIQAGKPMQLPGERWRVRAAGPAGDTHLLAYVSPMPRQFKQGASDQSPFGSLGADDAGLKALYVETIGARPGTATRYGASPVVTIREVP